MIDNEKNLKQTLLNGLQNLNIINNLKNINGIINTQKKILPEKNELRKKVIDIQDCLTELISKLTNFVKEK